MFSSTDFIAVSRKFVCIRLDSYENEKHMEWGRRLIGHLANTSFVVLTPDGKDWLTRSGRSPQMVFGRTSDNTKAMAEIAREYPVKFDSTRAVLQDFHSVSQALNVASADQRVLVLVAGPESRIEATREVIKPIINHQQVVGRFHVDFETNGKWTQVISNERSTEGILLIEAGEFGLKGRVLKQLPLNASGSDIYDALLAANAAFAATNDTKDFETQVRKGLRMGVRAEIQKPRESGRGRPGRR